MIDYPNEVQRSKSNVCPLRVRGAEDLHDLEIWTEVVTKLVDLAQKACSTSLRFVHDLEALHGLDEFVGRCARL